VRLDEGIEVEVAHCVARDHEEGVSEALSGEAHRAGGSERSCLDGVVELHVELVPVGEVRPDRLWHECERHHHLTDLVAMEEFEHVLEARLADDGDHRLRLAGGERPKARSFAAGHHHGPHR